MHRAGDARILHRSCESLASHTGCDVWLVAMSDETLRDVSLKTRVVQIRRRPGLLGRMANLVVVVVEGLRLRAGIYHVHDPELVGAAVLFRALGRRVVIDVHEDLPGQVLDKDYLPAWARRSLVPVARLVEAVEDRVATRVVVADPANAGKFRRPVVVQNFARAEEFAAPVPAERRAGLVYIGAISEVRGFREMVAVAERIASATDWRLRLAGPAWPAPLVADVPGLAQRGVDYLGVLDRRSVARELGAAGIGLALPHDRPNNRAAQPTKVFEYLAAGLPTVGSRLEGWSRPFQDVECVVLVDPRDVDEVVEAVLGLMADVPRRALMADEARQVFLERFSWSSQEARLLGLYREMLAS